MQRDAMNRGRPRAIHVLMMSCALVALTLAVFHGVFSNGFVDFDDDAYVTENAHVQQGLRAASVAWAFTTTEHANWHPLTWLSHMLDVQLFGLDPGMHHGMSLLLHAANAVLLLLLLVRMTGALWRSAFVAALFAVHPLHVESVAWIAERKDLLSTVFWLLALGAWLRYLESKTTARYALVLVVYAAGLMSKPMLVTLPFTLLLLDYWPLRRMTLPLPGGSGTLVSLLREKAPFFAMSAASCTVTFVVQRGGGAVQTLQDWTFTDRLANSLLAYVSYLGKTLWPARLAVFYPHPPIGLVSWSVAGSLALLASLTILAGRAPFVTFGWVWYLATLVPVIGWVQVGGQAMADRYTYVPLIGIFVAIAWGTTEIAKDTRLGRQAAAAVAVVALVALSAAAVRQVRTWASGATLFDHALAVTSGNWLAHNNLGKILFAEGRNEEAMTHYAEALRIRPDYPDAHYNLGIALRKAGRTSEATEHFNQALLHAMRLGSGHAEDRDLGRGSADAGRVDADLERYRQAVRSDPGNAEASYQLGDALFNAGRIAEAIEQYNQTLRLRPDYPEGHNNLGNALATQGRLSEAIEQYNQALRLKPDLVEAHNNLGVALVRQDRAIDAVAQYEQALRLKPDYAEAANNLGLALASLHRLPEAIESYRRALRIHPGSAEAHNNLGVALAHANQLPEAVEHFEQAVRLRPDFIEARANLQGAEEALRQRR